MHIVSWNVQCGKGVDGRIDFGRIRSVIDALAEGDTQVICLQEISRGYSDFAEGGESDQLRLLERYFSEYQLVFGPAVDRWDANRRFCFGNAILSRLPPLECRRHALPMPLDPEARRCMPRQALEIVVAVAGRLLRIVTTHLEYYSAVQRQAQAYYLAEQEQEWRQTANAHPGDDKGPFRRFLCPRATVLCGDFNDLVDDPAYRLLTASALADAWRYLYGEQPHAPTCGVHDREQWQNGPHCRDFFFLSRELQGLRPISLRVDTATDASDHQPLLLEVAV